MRCLSTRRTPEGFRRRRYELADGSRVSTIEVPVEMWARNPRTALQAHISSRQARGVQMLRSGAALKTVAYDLDVPYESVRRWAAALKP